ncbi:hypothetical protein KKB43_03800 [Patescibacteria group bacterium]|nr:hypothetical protein [Patescibacteria group bacterium]MBU4580113.1 hypothetical protein [Patescibacteria group bacterium]
MEINTAKIAVSQKNFIKQYEELFRFVEKTGEEVFIFPNKYKIKISLKPIGASKENFEVKDALNKIRKGRKEYSAGKAEEFEAFLKRKYPQYAKK